MRLSSSRRLCEPLTSLLAPLNLSSRNCLQNFEARPGSLPCLALLGVSHNAAGDTGSGLQGPGVPEDGCSCRTMPCGTCPGTFTQPGQSAEA